MTEYLWGDVSPRSVRVVLFDFDGTLSLIRSGWMSEMVSMMVEVLLDLKTGEKEDDLTKTVSEVVGHLTGKQTIYQMIALAEQVRERGGTPREPLEYKRWYLERLWKRIKHRVEALERGDAEPEQYLVPGSIGVLESLRERGLRMYLASGTDEVYMRREADLLGVCKYFDGGVFGAIDNYKAFSKATLIRDIISRAECTGEELLGFGDGYVEIENVKRVGGTAIGVATEEPECERVDEWKRERLSKVGADFIVPNYSCHSEWIGALFA